MKKHYKLTPLESGNYFTNLGWCYFDLKEGLFLQGGETITPEWWSVDNIDGDEPTCFTLQEDLDLENIQDILIWIAHGEMIAIVDETVGGIVGYVNQAHAERIYQILNKIKE